ncbi:MAG TPA: hypothetical protein VFN25_13295 [Dokdonella sp.]|uniref:hypothetical protein n=1 Tax=Dokdonella sp. TaxID=2291710 RepID=UPI002D7EA05C|nr:hypothetical protein [Dokdonella sp.]HET9033863.1 hypothetical protein [Dokdonella sp.]
MNKTIATVLSVSLIGIAASATAQTRFTSDAAFVRAGQELNTALQLSTVLHEAVPANPESGQSYPTRAGSWLQLGNVGNQQASIQSVRLYAYALTTSVQQRVKARFRMWNAHDSSADPVFARPAEFIVDLSACPCNFDAGQAYSIDIDLPKTVFTEGTELGFSQLWLTDPGNGVLTVSRELVPALDRQGIVPIVGDSVAAYANAGRSPEDLDFIPDDSIFGASLGLALFGEPMALDICSGASGFQHQFQEEFDNASQFFQRWKATPNFGQLSIDSGQLGLAAPDAATQFPYIASRPATIVIPPTGNFMVRWIAEYTGVGPAGDGEMVISRGTPLNGDDAGTVPTAMRSWQDSSGFYIDIDTASGVQQVGGGQGTSRHDMAYCWVDGKVELWKDGAQLFSQTNQPSQRPDSLWFGNPIIAGSGPWNALSLFRVWVRGDLPVGTDLIFRDDFEVPPGTP